MVSSSRNGGTVLTTQGVKTGMVRLFPIALFTLPFGLAFAVAAKDAGLTDIQAISMSILTFSGAAQFAALDFWGETIAFGSLAMVVLALNARHVIMGVAVSPWINQLRTGQRVLTLSLLSDPNFADSQPSFRRGERDAGILFGGGVILWVFWVTGTVIGVLGGTAIGDTSALGIDVVMPCFFVAVVIGQLKGRVTLLPIAVASVVSVALLGGVPTGWNVVLGALAGGIAGVWRHAK